MLLCLLPGGLPSQQAYQGLSNIAVVTPVEETHISLPGNAGNQCDSTCPLPMLILCLIFVSFFNQLPLVTMTIGLKLVGMVGMKWNVTRVNLVLWCSCSNATGAEKYVFLCVSYFLSSSSGQGR